jgi:trans-aconitate 2-methyltransferase
MAYSWDAADYARSSSVQQVWAKELIAKLKLQGNEAVLDIGCGDGKVTAEIASLVPEGSVVGVDKSPAMVSQAVNGYPSSLHSNLRFQICDAAELPFDNEFDVIFSNATLHWLVDHRPALKGIQRSLKANGRILLQMGGQGNAARVVEAMDLVRNRPEWSSYFANFEFPYGFYGPGEYCKWLVEAGLICCRVELIPKEAVHANRDKFAGWLRTTWLPYSHRVPPDQRNRFLQEVEAAYIDKDPVLEDGSVHVQMVRLEVESIKE